MAELKNTVLSVAIVPVGITQFREEKLKQVDKKCAEQVLDIASKFKRVCCSDEFFLLAERDIPPAKYYGAYNQLDDGVGSLRILLEDFKSRELPKALNKSMKISFASGYAATYALERIAKKLNRIKNLKAVVNPVKSEYWGQDITVSGLITTDDLIRTVKNLDTDLVVIPSVMLKPYSEMFLDGKTLTYVKEQTKKEFLVIKEIYSTKELVDYLWTFAE